MIADHVNPLCISHSDAMPLLLQDYDDDSSDVEQNEAPDLYEQSTSSATPRVDNSTGQEGGSSGGDSRRPPGRHPAASLGALRPPGLGVRFESFSWRS